MTRSVGHWLVDRQEAVGDNGVVVGKHRLVAEEGIAALERGGNAVDAAVTMAFTAAVVLPILNGIGGGGMMVIHRPRQGESVVIDYSMRTPKAAHETMYDLVEGGSGMLFGWRPVRDDANWLGWRSMAVPGTVAGLALALERYGTISLGEALAPAIRHARDGFAIDFTQTLLFAGQQETINRYPSSRRILSRDGLPLRAATWEGTPDVLVQADLARTLEAIAKKGSDALYRGEIADAIVTDMKEAGGLITHDDLAEYRPELLEPLTGSYRGYEFLGVPGSTAGPTVLETLNILEGYDLARLGHNSAAALHLFAEAARQAFADRFQHMADPQQVDVPLAGLTSKEYAAALRQGIDPERARERVEAGDPWPHEGRARPALAYAPSRPWLDSGTTTLAVADRDRNLVSLTQTLLAWSGIALPRTGIIMNDAMGWFDPEPGHANSVGPGKKCLSNMTPALMLKDGRPSLAVGAWGGRRIINTVTQVLLNVVDFGMGAQQAVSAPKADCSTPNVVLDARIASAVPEALRRMGHRILVGEQIFGARYFASPVAILVDPSDGRLHGGEDPFSAGLAVGF
ncbi:MAG: gamma-glutamyltransferase [Dehalococcoidia bacterium]